MGHALSLSHTHFEFRDPNPNNPLSENYENCEHVTRDPLNPDGTENTNYNATTRGDDVTDTAAVPDFRNEEYFILLDQALTTTNYELFAFIDNCTYNGDGKDCQNTPFDIYPSDVTNVMAYSGPCQETLTIGQAIRMHEAIDNFTTNYKSRKGELSDLFEPYKGEYYIAGALPEDHQAPLFQPGFNYQFIECENNIDYPSNYGDVFYYNSNNTLSSFNNDETNYQAITHPNHSAIHIRHVYGDFLDKPEKCYDNYNKTPNGGSITKFNDNILNTNVTITPQDSTAINNQNLIQNLDTGLYKIEKNYDDGSTQETIIFKENN